VVMGWVLDLIRRVSGQRMACFSVFLALPSAMLRSMATASCQVCMGCECCLQVIVLYTQTYSKTFMLLAVDA
jgi:hypothetical protein